MSEIQSIDVLIVGGGFTTMPLVRELERTGQSFVMISEQQPIWKQLEDEDALDFDLVSSVASSIYSFEQVEMLKEQGDDFKDGFPTARWYYGVHKKYAQRYAEQIINGRVTEIHNHADHSIVRLANGDEWKAAHVVIATAFRRKMNSNLKEIKIDESLAGKSVAVTASGDSSNLLMAKLVAVGAKVHLVTNGYIILDKMFATFSPLDDGPRFSTLDQMEAHNTAELSRWSYRQFIDGGYMHGGIRSWLAKLIDRDSMAVRQPKAMRPQRDLRSFFKAKAPVENGHIAIKYWPIDNFRLFCGDQLEQRVSDGYLLNDLPFFVDQGLIKLWAKSDTVIDHDAMTLTDGGETTSFDLIIDGDREEPAIPTLHLHDKPGETFQYNHRDTYFGVIAPELKNIYTVGFTRPTTGGLNNISEMQSLLTHRMIAEPDFRETVLSNIDERIAAYNAKYYSNRPDKETDYLTYYGTYTDEVARVLEIRPSVREAKSLIDLAKYYLFPNNAYYFRQKGRYKVEGADKLVDHITRTNQNYAILLLLWIRYPFYEFLALATIALAPIPLWIKPVAMLAHVSLPFTSILLGKMGLPSRESGYIFTYRKLTSYPVLAYPLIMPLVWIFAGIGAAFGLSLGLLIYVYAMIHLGTALRWNRKLFCDMKSKRAPENLRFFEKYRETFRKVYARRGAA